MTSSEISRSYDRISIKGSVTSYHIRGLCASLFDAIEKRGFQCITLDFSSCDKIMEAMMLPIMPIIANYRREGVRFECILPQEKSLERLFINTNWAHHINPSKYPQTSYTGGHVPALNYTNIDESIVIFSRVMDMILGQLKVERTVLQAVEWALWEIMDNVSNHAESPVGGFVQATTYRVANRIEFVVADSGMGIPESIGIPEHKVALQEAISEGVTRDKEMNAGNGLYGSYQVASLSGGVFEIHSLNGFLSHRPNGEFVIRQERVPYNGTSVLCGIKFSESGILNKALRFKGKPHNPPYDHIEHRFENDAGQLVFNVKEEAKLDLGSRQGGQRIRIMIENLLQEKRPIILDFHGISIISSSFADEVFGRLFVEMGARAFMELIKMRNVDMTVNGLIDRAIVQRTKLGNGDTS